MKKILFIAGTRPEIIKLAPLFLEMKRRQVYEPVMCVTGQHGDLADGALGVFGIRPDIRLETMRREQPLTSLLAAIIEQCGLVFGEVNPDLTVVQGDTASAYGGAWASFLQGVKVLHVEAGLRTGDLGNPFPEEAHRRAISLVSGFHAAPTEVARENLLREGVKAEDIVVTGNTVIDALYEVRNGLERERSDWQRVEAGGKRRILVTCHRRENFGVGIDNICSAVERLAREHPYVEITWVQHPNPAVNALPREKLSHMENVSLVSPLGFGDFLREMLGCYFIITDSGGIQEEAPALGRPVLVTRSATERPEAVETGANRLVGTDADIIFSAASELLADKDVYDKMASAGSPYGDGRAAGRICDFLEEKAFK